MNNTKNHRVLMTVGITLGALTMMAGIGVGIGYIIKNSNESATNKNFVWGDTWVIDGVPIKESKAIGAPSFFGTDKNNNGKPDGIDMLKTFIDERLHEGPEWGALKSITFGPGRPGWFIDDGSYGVYYPQTRELFLNTNPVAESFPYFKNPDAYLEDRLEVIYHTLFHEYGHHIANMHIVKSNQVITEAARIYTDGGSRRIPEPWSNNFVLDFKEVLNYNNESAKISDNSFIKKFNGSSFQEWSQNGYRAKSIGSLLSAYQLFAKSNGSATPTFPEALPNTQNKYFYAFNGAEFSWGPLLLKDIDDVANIPYYYEMQELFTRKIMQLMFRLKQTQHVDLDGSYLEAGESQYRYATSLLFDKLRYEDENATNVSGRKLNARYLHDGIFDQDYFLSDPTRANIERELFDAFLKVTGANIDQNGKSNDISIVWHENSSVIMDGNYLSNVNAVAEMKNIKFGGYFENDKDYNYVGYYNDNDEFVPLEIVKRSHSIGHKNQVLSDNWVSSSIENRTSYFLKDFIDATTITDKELYYSNDREGTTVVPFTNIKEGNNTYGDTSTSNFYNPRGTTGQVLTRYYKAHVKASNGSVVINTLPSVNREVYSQEESQWTINKIVKL